MNSDQEESSASSGWRDFLFSFRGRTPRRTYVLYSISFAAAGGAAAALIILLLFGAAGANLGSWPVNLVLLAALATIGLVVWIQFAVMVKRLHDRGYSGWLALVAIIPIVGLWIFFETLFLRGKNTPNRFGPPANGPAESRLGVITLGVIAILSLNFISPTFVRGFVGQTFDIPSGAQQPTLLIGDYFLVSKFAYGYSRYSLPVGQMPLSGRIFATQPKIGDMVVFKYPRDNSIDYIKRLVGVPGDHIQMKNGVLYINDKPMPKIRVADYIEDFDGRRRRVEQYRETLPNGVSYNVLDDDPEGTIENTSVFVVPEGHYFVMGDNRDNSADSRIASVGYVPFENFLGKAEIIFFSTDGSAHWWQVWKWPASIRYGRIGQIIH